MKRILSILATFLLTTALLTGCGPHQRGTTGLLVGGVAGGALGHAVTGGSALGTGVGAVAGAAVGHQIAKDSNPY